MEPPQPFTSGVWSFRGRPKVAAGLPGKADNGQAVGPVGGDLKLHHMVVRADDHGSISSPGLHVLVQHEDAVGDAVGELLLLRVEILQRADGIGLGVVGHQIARMEVGAGGVGRGGGAADVQRGVVQRRRTGVSHSRTLPQTTGPNTLSPALMSAGMEGFSGSRGL